MWCGRNLPIFWRTVLFPGEETVPEYNILQGHCCKNLKHCTNKNLFRILGLLLSKNKNMHVFK